MLASTLWSPNLSLGFEDSVCLFAGVCPTVLLWDWQWRFFLTVRKTTMCWHGHYHKQAVVSLLDGVHSWRLRAFLWSVLSVNVLWLKWKHDWHVSFSELTAYSPLVCLHQCVRSYRSIFYTQLWVHVRFAPLEMVINEMIFFFWGAEKS